MDEKSFQHLGFAEDLVRRKGDYNKFKQSYGRSRSFYGVEDSIRISLLDQSQHLLDEYMRTLDLYNRPPPTA